MVSPSATSTRSTATAASRRKKTPTAGPATGSLEESGSVDPQRQYRYTAEAAYYIAERRGFSGGSELEDWLQAEKQIAQLLSATSGKSH